MLIILATGLAALSLGIFLLRYFLIRLRFSSRDIDDETWHYALPTSQPPPPAFSAGISLHSLIRSQRLRRAERIFNGAGRCERRHFRYYFRIMRRAIIAFRFTSCARSTFAANDTNTGWPSTLAVEAHAGSLAAHHALSLASSLKFITTGEYYIAVATALELLLYFQWLIY